MSRPKRRAEKVQRCRRCPTTPAPDEYAWTRGLCPACLELDRQERRSRVGRKLLDKAKDGGTVDRAGQTFHVVVLPPKRRGGRRIR